MNSNWFLKDSSHRPVRIARKHVLSLLVVVLSMQSVFAGGQPDSYTVSPGQPITKNVLDNDSGDNCGSSPHTSFVHFNNPPHSGFTDNGGGEFTYDAADLTNGIVSFTYDMKYDKKGLFSSCTEKEQKNIKVTIVNTLLLSCPGTVIPDLDGAVGDAAHTFNDVPLEKGKTHYYHFTPQADGDFEANIALPKTCLPVVGCVSNHDRANIKIYKSSCDGKVEAETGTLGDGSLSLQDVHAGETIIIAITNTNSLADFNYDVTFTYGTGIVANADDMCYQPPVTTHGPYTNFYFCMNMFMFDFGMNCQEDITLVNRGNPHDKTDGAPQPLKNTKFLIDRTGMFSMRMLQGCDINSADDGDSDDDGNETCQNGSASSLVSMHASINGYSLASMNIFGDDDTIYNLGGMGPNGKETVSHWDLMHFALFPIKHFYATYQKWVDGKLMTYIGEVPPCSPIVMAMPGGPFDGFDTFRDVTDRNISTKIAGQPFDLTIAALTSDRTERNDAFKGKVTIALADGNGDSIGIPDKTMTFAASDHGKKTWESIQIDQAKKGVHLTFKFCADYDGNSYTMRSTCKRELSCNQKGKGYHICLSSDSFAVRPDHMVIGADDSSYDTELLRSGNEYNLSIQAYNSDGSTLTPDYNTSYEGIDINQTLFFADGSKDLSSPPHLHGTLRYSPESIYYVSDGVSEVNGTSPYVVGITFDDVGALKARFIDKMWAREDIDDTPQSCEDGPINGTTIPGAFVCGTSPKLTFIPDHFKVEEIHLHNHSKDSNITYLSNDLNMSASVDLVISARNADNNITQNFQQGSGFYEHDMTVDLNVTDWDSSDLGVHTRHPDGNTQPKIHDIAAPVKLGFGGADAKGTHHIAWDDSNLSQKLMFNYPRAMNVPVNPFVVPGSDINISVAAIYTSASDTTALVTGSGLGDKNATFLYARAKSSKYFYDDITDGEVTTPISVVVYCDTANCPGVDKALGETHEQYWFLSTDHNTSAGDGNITLTPENNGTVTPAVTLVPADKGTDNTITVGCTTNNTVDIDFDQTNPTDTNSWLIYNKDSDSVPDPFYGVHCIGTSDWGGAGKTGHVVGGKANIKKTKRLDW